MDLYIKCLNAYTVGVRLDWIVGWFTKTQSAFVQKR
jgi:hypothetical protein